MLSRLRDEERGLALIVAMLVAFVVLLLSVYVVNLSIHSSTSSAYDRKRVQSIATAEGGVNAFWSMLAKTAPQRLPCNYADPNREPPVGGALDVEPGTSAYTVSATYFDGAGRAIPCESLDQGTVATAVQITAVGRTNAGTPRTMQSYATLTEVRSGGFEAAIIADQGLNLSGNLLVDGPYLISANVYVNHQNLVINSGNLTIKGNVYVHEGSAQVGNTTNITGDLWTWLQATLDNPATIGGNLRSSTEYLGVYSGTGGTVGGCGVAGKTIASSLKIRGTEADGSPCIHPDSPTSIPPPEQPLPHICWEAGPDCQAIDRTAYEPPVELPSCTAALSYLTGGTISGNTLLHITNCPNLTFRTNDRINFNGNLTIVSDGGFTMLNRENWCGNSVCSSSGTRRDLEFIVNYAAAPQGAPATCTTGAGGQNIALNNNTNFWNAKVVLYTPCHIYATNNGKLEPQAAFDGQIMGGTVDINNKFAMRYEPILIPGVSPVSGFAVDVAYVREIASGS